MSRPSTVTTIHSSLECITHVVHCCTDHTRAVRMEFIKSYTTTSCDRTSIVICICCTKFITSSFPYLSSSFIQIGSISSTATWSGSTSASAATSASCGYSSCKNLAEFLNCNWCFSRFYIFTVIWFYEIFESTRHNRITSFIMNNVTSSVPFINNIRFIITFTICNHCVISVLKIFIDWIRYNHCNVFVSYSWFTIPLIRYTFLVFLLSFIIPDGIINTIQIHRSHYLCLVIILRVFLLCSVSNFCSFIFFLLFFRHCFNIRSTIRFKQVCEHCGYWSQIWNCFFSCIWECFQLQWIVARSIDSK